MFVKEAGEDGEDGEDDDDCDGIYVYIVVCL